MCFHCGIKGSVDTLVLLCVITLYFSITILSAICLVMDMIDLVSEVVSRYFARNDTNRGGRMHAPWRY